MNAWTRKRCFPPNAPKREARPALEARRRSTGERIVPETRKASQPWETLVRRRELCSIYAMVGELTSTKRTFHRSPMLAIGFAIAGVCFVILFASMARILPLFLRFLETPQAKLLPALVVLFAVIGGVIRRRDKRRVVEI